MENPNERIEKLLAMVLISLQVSATAKEKVLQLNAVGFSNQEVADLLGTSSAVVSQYIYEGNKAKQKSRSAAKKTTKGSKNG